MKKWLLGLASLLFVVCLAACGKEETSSTSWLEGTWHSEEWNVTYTFTEKDGKWTITFDNDGKEEVIAADAVLNTEDKPYTLTDADGTTYVIEKSNDEEIGYQQVAAEGVAGTTAQTTFTKVK